eukprot:12924120-Prorocentrum_lima.AAC.1
MQSSPSALRIAQTPPSVSDRTQHCDALCGIAVFHSWYPCVDDGLIVPAKVLARTMKEQWAEVPATGSKPGASV